MRRYWSEEPWGAWRDNMHAAIIAREVARLGLKRGQSGPMLDAFMVVDKRRRANANVHGFVNFLRMAAGGKRVTKPTKKPPSGKLKAKKSATAPARRRSK